MGHIQKCLPYLSNGLIAMDQTRSSVWMVCKHCPSRPEAKDHTWKQERRCSRWHCLELGWSGCPWAGVRGVGMENPFCPVYTEHRVSAEVTLWLLGSLPPKQTLAPSPNQPLLLPPNRALTSQPILYQGIRSSTFPSWDLTEMSE